MAVWWSWSIFCLSRSPATDGDQRMVPRPEAVPEGRVFQNHRESWLAHFALLRARRGRFEVLGRFSRGDTPRWSDARLHLALEEAFHFSKLFRRDEQVESHYRQKFRFHWVQLGKGYVADVGEEAVIVEQVVVEFHSQKDACEGDDADVQRRQAKVCLEKNSLDVDHGKDKAFWAARAVFPNLFQQFVHRSFDRQRILENWWLCPLILCKVSLILSQIPRYLPQNMPQDFSCDPPWHSSIWRRIHLGQLTNLEMFYFEIIAINESLKFRVCCFNDGGSS